MSKLPTDFPQLPGDEPSRRRRAWSDESLAPTVDHGLLQALVRKELSDENARALYRLMHSFASWNAAHAEALVAEYHRVQGGAES